MKGKLCERSASWEQNTPLSQHTHGIAFAHPHAFRFFLATLGTRMARPGGGGAAHTKNGRQRRFEEGQTAASAKGLRGIKSSACASQPSCPHPTSYKRTVLAERAAQPVVVQRAQRQPHLQARHARAIRRRQLALELCRRHAAKGPRSRVAQPRDVGRDGAEGLGRVAYKGRCLIAALVARELPSQVGFVRMCVE
jgi:hypothetical protein